MEFPSNLMLELKINPAKYAHTNHCIKTNHLILFKTSSGCPVIDAEAKIWFQT
jgi:hypothetical protein